MQTADDFIAKDKQMLRYVRLGLVVFLGLLTAYKLLSQDHYIPLLDSLALLLHEGGHVIFSWAGVAITALGGSLAQILFPVAFAAYFYYARRERISAAACMWWAFENFIGVGIYMRDAIDRALPLVGGEIHDFEFLFRRWGLYAQSTEIGSTTIGIGVVGMLASIGAIVYWISRDIDSDRAPE